MKSIYLRKKMLVACRRPVVATLLVIVALFSSCTGLTESPYTFVDPGNYYHLACFYFTGFRYLCHVQTYKVTSFPTILHYLYTVIIYGLLASFMENLPPIQENNLANCLQHNTELAYKRLSCICKKLRNRFFSTASFLRTTEYS